MKLLVLLIASCLLATPALAQQPASWLVGAWKLVEATQTEGGQTKEYLGPKPLGQVIFEANGHFSDILIRSDVPKFKGNNRAQGSAEENAAVVHGSIAYFGTYTLTGDTLNMHITGSTFPNWNDTEQTRIVRQQGDRLTWENAAASAGGQVVLIFERVK
jgi:Lipocalin-like domain